MHVPMLDLKRQYQRIKPEIDKAVLDVLDPVSYTHLTLPTN